MEDAATVALPDAAGAMLLTKITTAVAFFATAICPVVRMKIFDPVFESGVSSLF